MTASHDSEGARLFAGPGESRARCRAVDWSATPLGPVGRWPASLRTAVRLCLDSRVATSVWAGPEFTLIHNDRYAPLLGARVGRAMGRPAREAWSEQWHVLGPDARKVLEQGASTRYEQVRLPLGRDRGEEACFTYTSTPIRDDDGRVLGILNCLEETTHGAREQREREDFLSFALATAHLGAWDLDLEDGSTVRSSGHDPIFGYDRPLPKWTHETFAAHVLPEDRESVERGFAQAIRGEGVWSDECRIRRVDGEVRWVWIACRRRVDERGHRRLAGIIRDITDRRRAELALRDNEARFRAFFETAAVGTAQVSLEGRFSEVNQRFCEITGYRREELLQAGPGLLSVPEEAEVERERLRGLLEGDVPSYQVIKRYRRKDGRVIWVQANVSMVYDARGAPVYSAGVIQDVTERKQAEEAKGLLAAIVESSDDAILSTDTQGVIRTWNEGAQRLLGYPASEAVGRPVAMLIPPERPDEEVGLLARIGAGERVEHFETERLTRDGSRRAVSLTISPLRDEGGRVIGASKILRDITERKRGEEALRRSRVRLEQERARLQAIVDTMPVGMVIFDAAGRATRFNDEARRTWGGEKPLAGLEDFAQYKAFWPATGEPLSVEDWPGAQAVHRGRRTKGVVLDIERFDGSRGTIVASAGPIRGEGGRIEGAVTALQDITELRRAQAQLAEADRRKNQFLAVLSHELRNPLAPVKSSLYILDRAVPGSDQARRAKDVIERQIDQLSRLVDDLLDVTRITRGKIQLQRRWLELNDLVRRTLEDHRALLERSGLKVRLRAAPGEVFLDADWNRVAQVLSNLLQNAAKFTPAGGHVEIEVARDEAARQAVLSVTDDGVGMPPEILERLFEPFMQADQTLDRSKGGLGLGLALVKGLVEQHGGTISASSDGAGRGSRFVVRLPLALGATASPEPARAPAGGARRHVLVIEDNVDSADSLRDLLELDGHVVAVAYDGLSGLAAARRLHPDLVLCDLGLPGMDGYAVARAIRADQDLRGTRLVALSGYALPEDRRLSAEAGFERHLSKPPSLEKLAGVLGAEQPAPA